MKTGSNRGGKINVSQVRKRGRHEADKSEAIANGKRKDELVKKMKEKLDDE